MNKTAWLLLLVLVALGAFLRLYHLDEKSLWSDEVATIATSMGNSIDPDAYALSGQSFDPTAPVSARTYREKATHSHGAGNLGQTASILQQNVHPPLFFWLMHGWGHAFGLDPGTLRLPAVLFGILNIPLMVLLARQLARLDPQSLIAQRPMLFAWLAGAIMAFSAYQVDHAQDARQYTLLISLALLSSWLALRLAMHQGGGWFSWLFLGLLLGAGMLTQYFFIIFAGFIALYLIGQVPKQGRTFALKLLVALTVAGGVFLPWLPYFKRQMAFLASAGHYTAGLWNPVQLPERLWRIGAEFMLPDSPVGKLLPLIILLLPLVLLLVKNRRLPKPSTALGFVLLWLISILGGQVLLDLLRETHTATIRRYLLLASPAAYLLTAYALVALKPLLQAPWRHGQTVLVAGLILLMLADTGYYLFADHHSSDEFRQAAEGINARYQPGDLVLVTKSGAMAVGMAYYLDPSTDMLGVHVPEYAALADGTPLMTSLARATDEARRVWLVYSHAAPSTEQRLNQWLADQGFVPAAKEKVPGVKVQLLAR